MAVYNGDMHKGHRARMREKFLKNGFDGFSEHEILEMLLFFSIPRKDTNALAHNILDKYQTLANVLDASPEALMNEFGVGESTAILLTMIPKLFKEYEKSKWSKRVCLDNVENMGKYLISFFKGKENEEFALISLDANRNVQWSGIIIKGTIDRTEAYPRLVLNEALNHKATRVIFAHNHPSGTLAPSVADKEATKVLVGLLKGIGIEVLDHIIVSGDRYFSMKEMGFRF